MQPTPTSTHEDNVPNLSLIAQVALMCRRELMIAVRNPGQWLNPLMFFVVVVTLFPLGVGPSPATLESIAPGVLWVSALLSVMMCLTAISPMAR